MALSFQELLLHGDKDGARRVFEDFVLQLMLLEHDGMGIAARPGDWGIDAYVGDLGGNVAIWQAKFFIDGFGEAQHEQVRESFASAVSAAATNGYAIDAWTLCIPVEPDPKTAQWFTGWRARAGAEHDVAIDLWTASRIISRALRPAAWHMTRHFFPHSTAAAPDTKPLVTDRELGVLPYEHRARVLAAPGLMATMERLYEAYPPLRLGGRAFPIATSAAPETAWDDLEHAKGALREPHVAPPRGLFDERLDPTAKPLFERLVLSEDPRTRFDGTTFALERIDRSSGTPVVDCRMGRYFESLATSEALENELLSALARDPDNAAPLDVLPMRRRLHELSPDPVSDGAHRSSALSIATAVIYRENDGTWNAIVTPRSADVATHAHLNHVAPSGIFAPLNDWKPSLTDEFSIRRSLLREYVEELYADSDLERGRNLSADIELYEEVHRLQAMLDTGTADLVYTGLSHNLLTLRTEICTLLLVHDPAWLPRESSPGLARPLRLGWEYIEHASSELPAGRRYLRALRLGEDFLPAHDEREAGPEAMILNAAAALALAAPVAHALATRRGS
ncbi:MAG TPA: hypothetical protein VN238_10505 [Solirubrobacteraceae bacterium]|nr:hypothetical protein [Solirubrobacteraceae bacterium]